MASSIKILSFYPETHLPIFCFKSNGSNQNPWKLEMIYQPKILQPTIKFFAHQELNER